VINDQHGLLEETRLLASCTYENDTKWGKEASRPNEIFFHYRKMLIILQILLYKLYKLMWQYVQLVDQKLNK